MELKSFRITNYKCIKDSGDVPVGKYTALVGKNESGKTSTLKALHKFNPSTPEPYNELKDFPRNRYHEYVGDEPVTTLTFQLNDDEKEHLENIDTHFKKIEEIRVTKDYSDKFFFEFLPIGEPVLTIKSLSDLLSELPESINDLDLIDLPNADEIKTNLRNAIKKVGEGIEKGEDLRQGHVKQILKQQLQDIQNIAVDDPTRNAIGSTLSIIREILTELNTNPKNQAKKYLVSQFPTFIYFESYALIDSRIHLPSFVNKMNSGNLNPEEKTAHTMFTMVNLDPVQINDLGLTAEKDQESIRRDLDERAIRVSRASVNMTGDLVKIWEQRENRIDFDADGEYLRLWVTDNVDGSRIELEERSKGFQWFLSFYIVFNVESERGHKNAILLLDDPGLYLHASAQSDLIKVLRKLSENNQLIYTTHSPFMIDMDAIGTVKTVTETQDKGTIIPAETWSTDKDALFPLQAALGYSMSQSLFVGKNNLVVEGITDFWFLSGLSNILRDANRVHLHDSIVITPAGGAQKSSLLSAMLAGQKLKVGVLLDADKEGKKVRDDIVKNKIIKENRVIFVNEVSEDGNIEMEFEDLFPEDFYLEYVNKAYKNEFGDDILQSPLTSKKPRVRQRIEDAFKGKGFTFHKTRPARIMLEDFGHLKLENLPDELVTKIEKLCETINKRLKL